MRACVSLLILIWLSIWLSIFQSRKGHLLKHTEAQKNLHDAYKIKKFMHHRYCPILLDCAVFYTTFCSCYFGGNFYLVLVKRDHDDCHHCCHHPNSPPPTSNQHPPLRTHCLRIGPIVWESSSHKLSKSKNIWNKKKLARIEYNSYCFETATL